MTLLIPNLLNKKYTDSQGLVAMGQAQSDSNTLFRRLGQAKKILIHEISIFRISWHVCEDGVWWENLHKWGNFGLFLTSSHIRGHMTLLISWMRTFILLDYASGPVCLGSPAVTWRPLATSVSPHIRSLYKTNIDISRHRRQNSSFLICFRLSFQL